MKGPATFSAEESRLAIRTDFFGCALRRVFLRIGSQRRVNSRRCRSGNLVIPRPPGSPIAAGERSPRAPLIATIADSPKRGSAKLLEENRARQMFWPGGFKARLNLETGQDEPRELKDLRKTCATYYDEHVPESSVEILGHSFRGIIYRHYAHRAPPDVQGHHDAAAVVGVHGLIEGHRQRVSLLRQAVRGCRLIRSRQTDGARRPSDASVDPTDRSAQGDRPMLRSIRPKRASGSHRSAAAPAASVSYELPKTNRAAAVCCSGWFGPALEFSPGCKPAAPDNPTKHALPQAVNRTGTTPCCKARSRFPISRRTRPLFASRGRSHIASRDKKRSDRRKVWVCFR